MDARFISEKYRENYSTGHSTAKSCLKELLQKNLHLNHLHVIRTIIKSEVQVYPSECLLLIQKIEKIYHSSHDTDTEATMDFYLNDIKVMALVCMGNIDGAKEALLEKLYAIKDGRIRKDTKGNWKKEPEFTVVNNIKAFNYYHKHYTRHSPIVKTEKCKELEGILSAWYSEIKSMHDYSRISSFQSIKPRNSHLKVEASGESDIEFFLMANDILNKLLTVDYHYDKIKKSFRKKLLTDAHLSDIDVTSYLQTAVEQKNIVLILGAGVSIPFGIPNWENLLIQLLSQSAFGRNISIKNIFQNTSYLKLARLLDYVNRVEGAGKSKAFLESIRLFLYKDLKEDITLPYWDEFLNIISHLDSIITYNFDNILEQHLTKANVKFNLITSSKDSEKTDMLNIYHVHGFIPQMGEIPEFPLVFGESEYHTQFTDVYSWNNLVMLNKFCAKTCLFFGVSLNDPNIRRLLDVAKQRAVSNQKHFIIRKKNFPSASQISFENILESDFFNLTTETDDSTLGLQTIWVDNNESGVKQFLHSIIHKNNS